MSKFVAMAVFEVESADLEGAQAAASIAAPNGAVIHVADSLNAMMNPYHWADAQNAFGSIKAAEVVAENVVVEDVIEDN